LRKHKQRALEPEGRCQREHHDSGDQLDHLARDILRRDLDGALTANPSPSKNRKSSNEVNDMKNTTLALTIWAAFGLASLGCAQSFNIIYSFTNPSIGADITGTPYIGSGGVLYATSGAGGSGTACSSGCGTVFSLTPPVPPATTWTEATIYSLQGSDGEFPYSGVIPGANGTLLGTTTQGGSTINVHCAAGCGVFFQLTPPAEQGESWTNQVLFNFPVPDKTPHGLVLGPANVLYGAATYGGSQGCGGLGCGSLYELEPPAATGENWTRTPIHQFSGGLDGEYPNSPLVLGASGTLYGTFEVQGATEWGGAYELIPPTPPSTLWTFQRLYSFKGEIDGEDPLGALTAGPNGILYGTTSYGGPGCGSGGCLGTVFSLTPPAETGGTWQKAGLYAFKGGVNDGAFPISPGANLAVAADGSIYGVTLAGGGTGCGGSGCGVLFHLTPPAAPGGGPWTETILHSFTGGADGQNPQFAPAIDAGGVVYGVSNGAGTACGTTCGAVYQYVP
jgi:hypothetical protein